MFRRLLRTRRGPGHVEVDSKEHIVEPAKEGGGSTESCSNFARLDDEGHRVSASQMVRVDSKATNVEVARTRTRSLPLPPSSIKSPAITTTTTTEQPVARSSSASFQRLQIETRGESNLDIEVHVPPSKNNQESSDLLDHSRTEQSSIATPRHLSSDQGCIEMSTGRSRTQQSSVTFADSAEQPQASASRDTNARQSTSTIGKVTPVTTSSVDESMGLGRSTGTDSTKSESNLFRAKQSARTARTGTSTNTSTPVGGIQVSSFSSIFKSLTGNSVKPQNTSSAVHLTRQDAYEPPTNCETATSSESSVADQNKPPFSPSLGGIEISVLSFWNSVMGNSRYEQNEVDLERKPTYEPPSIVNGRSSESQVVGSLKNKSSQSSSSRGAKEIAMRAASEQEPSDDIPSKVPLTDGWFGRLLSFNIGPYILVIVFLAIFVGFLYSAAKEYGYYLNWANIFQKIDWDQELNVAFIGTAFLFVNDISRVMESISDYHIHQMSVIHPGGSLGSLLATGNGMYKVWQTEEADIGEGYYENYGGYRTMYDFGACSVAQLLQGYDEYMDGGNAYGVYYDDGLNPCLQDYIYENYVADKLVNESFKWDFVVLADQTKRMAIELARNDTVTVLADNYAPFLLDSGATPVIVGPHAFMSSKTNMTGLGSIPEFTALIHEGVDAYVEALASELPGSQAPVVCPVHLGFLLVWEEDYDFWQTLFVRDMMHSSLRGTYLFASILYTTLFGHLPDADVSIPEYMDSLFVDVRKITGQYNSDFTREDAAYLRNIARRVVLNEEFPTSLDAYLY